MWPGCDIPSFCIPEDEAQTFGEALERAIFACPDLPLREVILACADAAKKGEVVIQEGAENVAKIIETCIEMCESVPDGYPEPFRCKSC